MAENQKYRIVGPPFNPAPADRWTCDRAVLEAMAEEFSRTVWPGRYVIAADGIPWGRLQVTGPGVWRITQGDVVIARRPR